MEHCFDPHGVFGAASYIKAQQSASDYSEYDPIPFFRREIDIGDEDIRDARIYVQSPGFAVYYINGEPITEDIFISALSDYRSILWYDTYDVTHLLKKGRNVVCAIASNGFLNESFDTAWHFQTAAWRDAPQILLSLYMNGRSVLVSDGEWRTSRDASHIIYSHLRSGEYVDMRKYDESWLKVGYDDSSWQKVIVNETGFGSELRPIDCEPVRETEIIEPRSVTKTEQGYLVDFGVNSSGYMEITLTAPRGTEILFRYSEEVDEALRPRYNQMDTPYFYCGHPFHLNKLIASGGVDTFKPKFCYHGFRYVTIEGLESAPPPHSMRAYFIHNDIARRSDLATGNEIINFIYQAGIRSVYSNLFWCLTDCPTREKLGWMNDAQATAEQTLINFDIVRFYKKWFEDIKADMDSEGLIHGVIPTYGWGENWGPVCDCHLFELPYRVYMYTGDAQMLTGAIAHFERYLSYLERMIAEDHEFTLGDWLGNGSSKRIPKTFIRDIYYLKALKITALAYRLAQKVNEPLESRYTEAHEAFQSRWLDESGRCTVDEQTSLAMMIMFGLYRDKSLLAHQLADAVERDGFKLTSGMVGVQYLYDALSESGHPELAYKLITESEPGYKTWYEHGATTLWESWDGVDYNSHNHHMFSNVIGWFYKSLLGIAPNEESPAFETVYLKPCFIADIGYVRGYMDTVRGRIEAAWEYKDGMFEYTVTIPESVNAFFNEKKLDTGKNVFFVRKG